MPGWRSNIKLSIRLKTFLRNNFIKFFYNPLQVFRRKYHFADNDLFRHILIQTKYKCTRKCSFCHYGINSPPINVEMDGNLFFSIINQLSELNYGGRLGLFEMNEPLTDPRFKEFLIFTRKTLPKAWIFISSNGDLLNYNVATDLFNHGLNYIFLSSYDRTALEKNLNLINKLSPKNKKNINHINRTYQKSWTSRGGHIKKFKRKTVYKPCDLVFRVLYIKPSGKIYSCYNDFYNQNEMGDLNNQRVKDIWFGNKFKELRKQLIKGNRDYSNLCQQCDYIGFGNLPKIPLKWKIKKFFK